jgi:hypothetical protein
MKLYLLILKLLASQACYYCSCPPPPKIDDNEYNSYDLIVSSTILKVSDKGFERTILLKVDTCFKGNNIHGTVEISSPSQEGICAISPKVGEHWLIYANAFGKIFKTNLCTRTKTMNPKAWDYYEEAVKEDLKFLQNKLKNTSG